MIKIRLDFPGTIFLHPASGSRNSYAIARGFEAIAEGYSLRYPSDEENLLHQFEVYDALYAWCRLQTAKGE